MRLHAARFPVRLHHGCHCTFALTDALALMVNVHVFRLLPPLEQAPDQIASRPLDTDSVICVPDANGADPLLPTATLIPAGDEVMRDPLRPVADTVKVTCVPGGGAGACGVKLRTLDHAPTVPAEFTPRTRHQCWRMASDDTLSCDAVTVWSTTRGAEKLFESST